MGTVFYSPIKRDIRKKTNYELLYVILLSKKVSVNYFKNKIYVYKFIYSIV